jgi:hypothetical protein
LNTAYSAQNPFPTSQHLPPTRGQACSAQRALLSIQVPTIKHEPSAVSLGKRKMHEVDPPSDSEIIYITDSDENSHLKTSLTKSSKPKKWTGNHVLGKKSTNILDLTLNC